jgi:hypothetical protein
MVTSSMLAEAVSWVMSLRVSGCGARLGMLGSRLAAPAIAATPALYFRKSRLETFLGDCSFSVVVASTKKLSP